MAANLTACLGYCGRLYSDICEACPRGYRSDGYNCNPCGEDMKPYDIMYLFLVFFSCFICISWTTVYSTENIKSRIILTVCGFFETILSIILTILVFPPVGSFSLTSCGVERFTDWYTVFDNPEDMFCANEAVFPLYTIILAYCGFAVLFMLIFRWPLIYFVITDREGLDSIFLGLVFFPVILLAQAALGGILYYSLAWILPFCTLAIDAFAFYQTGRGSIKNFETMLGICVRAVWSAYSMCCIVAYFETWVVLWIPILIAIIVPSVIFVVIYCSTDEDS